MKIIERISDIKSELKDKHRLGFVPTMGALHKGHAALIKESVEENENTCVSIFVNPAQFNDPKDFEKYPNTWETDVKICRDLGVSHIFSPKKEEIYKPDESITLSENFLSKNFEGEMRPGHFEGVLLVMLKLLNIIKPQFVYMGEKDYQQCLLIDKLCRQFFLGTKVKPVATVRDESGLPFSSRNLNLSEEGLEKARKISHAFLNTKTKEEFLKAVPQVELDYYGQCKDRLLMAHRVEGIRLLDNKRDLV